MYLTKCKQVNILPLCSRFDVNDLTFLHKIVYELIPMKLPSYLKFYECVTRLRSTHLDSLSLVTSIFPKLNTRNYSDIGDVVSVSSFRPFENSFFYRSHLQWNTLPLEIRKISSPSDFRAKLETHLWRELQASFDTNSLLEEVLEYDDWG